ncbi:heparinase II/III domain-containing protein [Paenibacillus contaminans]|uniref:Heparinase II/III-like C-terminal domain-containing protein n=1 Tax=Paenibacillus contaminans TaxID=450362 RepID=A0A329LWX5_9BACL|nr:heparinase II/III family protein [Paenibacillus contaminans]RAV09227.1 hypothetical protein DQG23_39745 [Paenibacillus contaminans]
MLHNKKDEGGSGQSDSRLPVSDGQSGEVPAEAMRGHITCAKKRSSLYTSEKVAAARKNVRNYGWAAGLRDSAVSKAERYAAFGLDALWSAVPAQTLPRSYGVNQAMGSPITGRGIDAYGNYPYRGDPLNEPWKIVDPSSGYTFPSNDFGAYYASGLDVHGIFQPGLADRCLLVNTLYPEKGPDWGVDDGFGWVDENGVRYTFIAYYVHWILWFGADGLLNEAVNHLRDAYLYTGDAKYARSGLVLLDRIADVYPDMDISWHDAKSFLNSHGLTGQGKVIGNIWETFLIKDLLRAYDAFYPAADDPETVAFLSRKAASCKLANPKTSGDAIRRNIEDGIVKQVFPAVRNAQVHGNDGMHQSALAMAAVVYDTMPETKEWLDFVFQTGGLESDPWRVTGGNVFNSLVCLVDRDGNGDEASPGYNALWLTEHQETADILDGYDKYPEADLYRNVKFRGMFYALLPQIFIERYTNNTGDTGSTGKPGIGARMSDVLKGFDKYGDPLFAQWAYKLNGDSADGIHRNIFAEEPEQIAEAIRQAVAAHGTLAMDSGNETGYGLAALRDGYSSGSGFGSLCETEAGASAGAERVAAGNGEANTLRDVWMYYGRNTGHGHFDTLQIGMHGFGLDVTPDLGYPEFADDVDMHRAQWVINTVSHNTVVVDKRKQSPQWVGLPHHFDDSGAVQLIDVEAPLVYPQTRLYRRMTAMIRADEVNSYAVDIFRVKGGSEHCFSFHGADAEVTTAGLSMSRQADESGVYEGTYAGPDVPFGVRADDIEGWNYRGSGYHWLRNVDRDRQPGAAFSVDWKLKDTWNVYGAGEGAPTDVHVRLTMLGELDEVALADGMPPRNKPGNPSSLRYMLAKRTGSDLESSFTSVIETYKGERFVSSIEPAGMTANGVPVSGADAVAVRVALADGRVDTIASSLDPSIKYVVGGMLRFKGSFGVYSERNGRETYRYVHDGTVFAPIGEPDSGQAAALTGTVFDFTRELSVRNELIVEMNAVGVDLSQLQGAMIIVANDGVRNAAYRICGAAELGGGRYSINIGRITTIRAYANPSDLGEGYLYDVAEGAAFRIPLTHSSVRK